MKLIERTTIYYLIYTLFIFTIGTLLFYFLISNVINNGIDEALHQEKEQIIENLKYETDFSDLKPTQYVILKKIKKIKRRLDKYSTISLKDSTGADVNFRQLESVYRRGNENYQIIVRQSLQEAESLIQSLIPVEIVLFLILLAGVLSLSRIISKEIWDPFYNLLDKVRDYDLSRSGVIKGEISNIEEFDDLSNSIEKMTQKIYDDFISQKEFNENSSHELQTPLAIIRNKLELLIQSENMGEEDLKIIQTIFDAVKRLNLLNKSLILLSKIDNEQYNEISEVNVNNILSRIAENFKESLIQKEIQLKLNLEEESIILANVNLMEILLSNLFSNALKHNIPEGFIEIVLSEKSLIIKNSGNPLTINSELLFQRFIKQSPSENSVGLGLSIVKKICDISAIHIEYTNSENLHVIELNY